MNEDQTFYIAVGGLVAILLSIPFHLDGGFYIAVGAVYTFLGLGMNRRNGRGKGDDE